jgi:hypothetical protein
MVISLTPVNGTHKALTSYPIYSCYYPIHTLQSIMKVSFKAIAACSLIIQAAAAFDPVPSVTVVHHTNIAVRQDVKRCETLKHVPSGHEH